MKKKLIKSVSLLLALALLIGGLSTAVLAQQKALPDATTPRVLHLYNYAPQHESDKPGDGTQQTIKKRQPLKDVSFEIWKVTGVNSPGQTPTEQEITDITTKSAGSLTGTIKTNDKGYATHTFGTTSTNDGLYLVKEVVDPLLIETPSAPFYLNVPLTHPNGSELLYDMYVYPKNDLKGAPTVDKNAGNIGDKENSYHIGQVFTYFVRGSVPDDLATAKKYEFTDTLDSKLNYEGNLSLTLLKKDDTTLLLTPTTHYTTTGTSNLHTAGGEVKMQLTTAGMQYIANNLGSGGTTPEIRMSFDASINHTAAMGGEIPNDVTLNFINSTDNIFESHVKDGTDKPDDPNDGKEPVVYTGGFKLKKIDKNNALITESPAVFQIATTEDKAKAGTYLKQTRAADGTITAILDETDPGYTTAEALMIETKDGLAELKGLAYNKTGGTDYWLVETKAPQGYNLLAKPQKITVTATSYATEADTILVTNTKGFTLPATGGIGGIFSILMGLTLIIVAVVLLVIQKKKKQQV